MRLRYAVLAAALAATVTTTAAFAAIPGSKTRTLRGSAYLQSGASLEVKVKRQGDGFRVNSKVRTYTKGATRLRFYAYPCAKGKCAGVYSVVSLDAQKGRHTGHTFVLTGAGPKSASKDCVFVQVLDTGPKGKARQLVKLASGKTGIRICE
jgi:hypothetical protein